MLWHVFKKILAPGKCSEINHLFSWVGADAPIPKTCFSFIMHTCLKYHEESVLKRLKKCLELIFENLYSP